MSQIIGTAPGIDFREQNEELLRAQGVSNAIGMVGYAAKGPTEPVLLTTPQQCISVFGEPSSVNSPIQGALECLKNGGLVWFKRVVGSGGAQGVTGVFVEQGSNNPDVIFTTKEKTAEYNNTVVKLTFVVEEETATGGTVSKKLTDTVIYELTDSNGNVVERIVCSSESTEELYYIKAINRYSEYIEAVEYKPLVATVDNSIYTFTIAGGNSGETVDTKDLVSGMDAFKDPEGIDMATLVVPNGTDQDVWDKGIEIAEYRKDILYIPSLPTGLTPTTVANLVQGKSAGATKKPFDNTYVAVYWPNGKKRDAATGQEVIVDIAPYVAAAFAKSDDRANVWTAPAGVKRAVIQGLDGLEYNTTKEERDTLYADVVNINSITSLRGYGLTIMGVRTSKFYKITDGNTALRYVNIRRLCNYIRKVVLNESVNNLFDANDSYTWNDWKMRIEPYLRTIKDNRGLYDYQIIMDESTVTQNDIDNGRMPGLIKIAPTKPSEYIIIGFVVAKDGTVSFSEATETV